MLSKKEKKQINDIMENVVEDYMRKEVLQATSYSAENLSFVFTYKMTENLVRHSKTLGILTGVLLAFTIILAGLTGWHIYLVVNQ